MTHNQYLASQAASHEAFVTAQAQAWQYITRSWHTVAWTRIPDQHRTALGISSNVGMYNGNLCTQAGADSMRRAVLWLNRSRQ